MNILIIKTVPGEISEENNTYNIQEIGIAKAIRKQGHKCDILCCSDTGKWHAWKVADAESDQGVNVFCAPSKVVAKNGWPEIHQSLLEKYDIYQASEYNQLFTWHLANKFPNKVAVWHGPYYHPFNTRYNIMCKAFDLFFLRNYLRLNTPFLTKSCLASRFLSNKGISNIQTIGVGLDLAPLLAFEEREHPFIASAQSSRASTKLLYIGKIEKRRNVNFLLSIVCELKSRGENPELFIVGNGGHNDIATFWKRANILGVTQHIKYTSEIEQKHLRHLYAACDFFLFPSLYDIFGMVLLEAMFFGCTVISSINGGASTLINNGINGFIVDEFHPGIWCDIIQSAGTQRRQQINANAKITISDSYTWDVLVRTILSSHHRLASGVSPS